MIEKFNKNNFDDDEIDFIPLLIEIVRHRFIIILGVFIFSIFGVLYYKLSSDIYTTNATILINDSQSDPSSFINNNQYQYLFENNVDNEDQISLFKSSLILNQLVDDLNLDIKYYRKHLFKQDEQILKESLPFSIEFKNPSQETKYIVEYNNKDVKVIIDDLDFSFLKTNVEFQNKYFKYKLKDLKKTESKKYRIIYLNKQDVIEEIKSKYSIVPIKNSNTYNLSYTGTNKDLNYKILDGIINQIINYNISEKKKVYELSINFINTRTKNLEKKIDSLNFLISNFKVSNKFFEPETQTESELINLIEIDDQIFNNSIQIELSTKLFKELEKQENFTFLPTDIGIENENINKMVNLYNNIIIEKNNLILDATEKNPLIVQYQNQLIELRSNIFKSLNIYIDKLKTKSKIFDNRKQTRNFQVNSFPVMEAELKNLERYIVIQTNLHAFLNQKKEEALISISSLTSNIDVINEVDYLIDKKSKKFYVLAFPITSIFITIGSIFLIYFIRTLFVDEEFLKQSLKNVNFLGIIRYTTNNSSIKNQSLYYESLRRIFYNIKNQFINPKNEGTSVMVTSCFKNEGKTFTAFNFSKFLSTLNKKVILIGTDLRNPDLLKFYGEIKQPKGLTNIIANNNHISLVSKYKFQRDNFDTIFVGTKTNNVVDIFNSEKFDEIISYLKTQYDYVIFDTAPFMLMADSLELFKKSDYILNVFRKNYSPKKAVNYFKEHINKYNIKNVGYVITDDTKPDKLIDKYGYGYGYGYGYWKF